MAAPTRGREDDGRDLVGSGDPGRTGRGGAGRVRSILGANQGWARLCGYGHMFSPGCEWLQSLCSAHPAWASSLVPSPFLHPPTPPALLDTWASHSLLGVDGLSEVLSQTAVDAEAGRLGPRAA